MAAHDHNDMYDQSLSPDWGWHDESTPDDHEPVSIPDIIREYDKEDDAVLLWTAAGIASAAIAAVVTMRHHRKGKE